MIPEAWLYGLAGGLMIGGAAALYLLISGRVMGASGILRQAVSAREPLAFVAGLIVVPAAVVLMTGAPETHVTASTGLLIAGGLLTGFGTRLANGCTSGHGVCGMSRFSRRSIAATAMFLTAGVVAMAILRHGLGVI